MRNCPHTNLQENLISLPPCTTTALGTCTIVIPRSIFEKNDFPDYVKLMALVSARLDSPYEATPAAAGNFDGNLSTFLTPDVEVSVGQETSTPQYVASLVLDRNLYLPVDALHVTGGSPASLVDYVVTLGVHAPMPVTWQSDIA